MDNSKRVERVARAMARYRLGRHPFTSSLNPDLMNKLYQAAEDKLWRSLVDEAKAVVEAIDVPGPDSTGHAAARHDRAPAMPNDVVEDASDRRSKSKIGDVSREQNEGEAPGRTSALPPSSRPLADPASEGLRSAFAALADLATTGASDSAKKK